MKAFTTERLFEAVDQTWAPAERIKLGPWVIRRGDGGGQRVSAASLDGSFSGANVDEAEAAMATLGQRPLFMVRAQDTSLDATLGERDYEIVDPVLYFIGKSREIRRSDPQSLAAIQCDEPLEIMKEIWETGGINEKRISVMKRTPDPKTYILGRYDNQAIGCAFVACHREIAMLHALEVSKTVRRSGVARNILGKSAAWADDNGAEYFAAVTLGENLPAQKLFTSFDMQVVDSYHYRRKRTSCRQQ